ncbi:TolC family protein [Chitinophaga sancti]|uniref:Outer membrane protein TolC n=1 Tax=Chitinophaga sancti TaxID=1004 RepID=A0A1K1PT14_9BACT|nr:TolC family protein [Chitinophaga sancti]WQD61662.1 TolC family protein [Chitinophaga sancti]WQG92781.1 TolC family protein [Chitinophaga sancti]SFW50850.1 Outer membrane protein TolC [Chitinophaga sancti]
MKRVIYLTAMLGAGLISTSSFAQQVSDSVIPKASLQDCIQYALTHQPAVKQSLVDQEIAEHTIKSKLADWYPQLNLAAGLNHYLKLQTSYFNGAAITTGVANTSSAAFTLTQNIFNRDVLLASRTAKVVRQQAAQNTTSNQIDVVSNVSKAYYDMLLTKAQVAVLDEDIVRLERSLKDAFNQYQSGIVDKTDYKRATISLNNAKAQKKTGEESLKAKNALLKQYMGFPPDSALDVKYDTIQMAQNVQLDTNTTVTYQNRIEYQLLQTQRSLLEAELRYNKWSYLPTVSASGSYTFAYFNKDFGKLYNNNYPNSLVGLTVSLPIFQGFKRTHNIKIAELNLRRTDWDVESLKQQINTQYTQAMAAYKSNLNEYFVMQENVQLAKEVFNLIDLQYREGIKTYLEVITAQTDLRSAELNYYNAMYTVLSSKIDLEVALGTLTPSIQ